MTKQSGKGQTTHSSQLLSVWNKTGVWGWVSDNILQLLCKNFSYALHFCTWQHWWLTRPGWIATWQVFLQFFLLMLQWKTASTSIFESLASVFFKGFSGFFIFMVILPHFSPPTPPPRLPLPRYKVSKSRNCSSVVMSLSLCRQMLGRRGRGGGGQWTAFFFLYKTRSTTVVSQTYWKKQERASFQNEKFCLIFLQK